MVMAALPGIFGSALNNAAGEVQPSLKDIIASTVFDLDATIPASYTSGQEWNNIVASPADGSAQSAHDFYRGVDGNSSTADPTFSTNKFAFDGTDFLTTIGNTDFLNKLHRSTAGNKWWLAFAFSRPSGALFLLDQCLINSGNRGLSIRITSAGALGVFAANGSSIPGASTATGAVPTGTSHVIISYNKDTNTLARWINGAKSTASLNFGTSSANASFPTTLGGLANGTTLAANGTEFYAVAGGNDFLSDADASALIAEHETRHARDYTP